VLSVAYQEFGPDDGTPVLLLHGWPYTVESYRDVAPLLAAKGCRVIAPMLRGYGETRFLDAATMRSGEQAAIGSDVRDLIDALGIERAVLAGFDWGGRGSAIVAALWPERVIGLVSAAGYPILSVAGQHKPADVAQEHRFWYQHYFQTERGRLGLAANRKELVRLLWTQWSPNWRFDDATLLEAVRAFDNPDFVDVTIHSYRHRMGNTPGDPRYAAMEVQLATLPKIGVPTIAIHGDADGVQPVANSAGHARFFTGPYQRRVQPGIGHNPPAEAPRTFADAVLDLAGKPVG
jgi:pimeloyl-ACP methyl ester carboxylesterase